MIQKKYKKNKTYIFSNILTGNPNEQKNYAKKTINGNQTKKCRLTLKRQKNCRTKQKSYIWLDTHSNLYARARLFTKCQSFPWNWHQKRSVAAKIVGVDLHGKNKSGWDFLRTPKKVALKQKSHERNKKK